MFLWVLMGDEIKDDEMSRACDLWGAEEKCIQCFVGESWQRDPVELLGTDGWIILKGSEEDRMEGHRLG